MSMGIKKTHDEFLKELKNNNKYVYKEYEIISKYNGANNKITLKNSLGTFKMSANNLLRGGVPKIESAIDKTKYFINKCRLVHNNKYDYSMVKYVNSTSEINILCPIHGEFKQTSYNHSAGGGCRKCGNESQRLKMKNSKSDFIKSSELIHGDKYDYSLVKYINSDEKVRIICPIHGIFEQTPSNHLSGHSCSKCTNVHYSIYSGIKNKETYVHTNSRLYVIRLYNQNENFYKIGITTKSIKERFKRVSRYNYNIILSIKDNLFNVVILENFIHELMKDYSYIPNHKFSGYTECFYDIDDVIIEFAYANLNNRIKLIEKEVDKYD